MVYISWNKLWESEFDNIDSKRDKLQDMRNNQIKLEVDETYKKVKKITTNFQLRNNEDVISKAYLDEKMLKKTVIYHYQKKITTNLNYNSTNKLRKIF